MKAIKIALLYWLQQALRLFCPHSTRDSEAVRSNAHVCPNCALAQRVNQAINSLCGWRAYSQLRKCDLCHEPLADQGPESCTICASCDHRMMNDRAAQEMEYDLPI